MASTAMAVLARSGYDWKGFHILGLGVSHPIWLGLGALSAWNAGNLFMRWWNNTWVYITRFRMPNNLIEETIAGI